MLSYAHGLTTNWVVRMAEFTDTTLMKFPEWVDLHWCRMERGQLGIME